MSRFVRSAWGAVCEATGLGSGAGHTTDSLDTVKKGVAAGAAVLADVREADEWRGGHLAMARHLPLSALQAGAAAGLPAGAVVYLHCASGRRCLTAADLLRRQGYDARPLADGFGGLAAAGFAVAK